MGGILSVACPQIVFPYLRGNAADLVQRAGFPPVHLAEINFQAMYEQQQAAGRCRRRHVDAVKRSACSAASDPVGDRQSLRGVFSVPPVFLSPA